MKKKLLSGCFAALLCLWGMYSVMAEAEVYKPIISMNFDGVSDGQINSYSENGASATFDNKESANICGDNAPEGKEESLSTGDVDRAVKISVGNAKDNPNMRFSLSPNYFTGKLKLAFQFYVPNVQNASYGLLSVHFRNASDANSYSNLLSLRGNKAIQYFPTLNSSQNDGTFNVKQWYLAEFYIDGDNLTYDVYLNGNLKYENCPLKEGVSVDQLRFAVVNSNQSIKNTYVYVDDIFFGMETDRPTPLFSKTIHNSGMDYPDMTDIPRDMTGIETEFPYYMDEASFEGNVSLTRGDTEIPVPFSGEYNKETGKYTVYLKENAMPCTQYRLTFGKNIKTSNENDSQHAGVSLTTDEVIVLSMEKVDFTVLDAYFTRDSAANEQVDHIGQNEILYANVDYIATDMLEEDRKLSAFVVICQNGMMTDVLTANTVVAAGGGDGQEKRLQISIPAGGFQMDENMSFELVVWDDFFNMTPIFKNTMITNQETREES